MSAVGLCSKLVCLNKHFIRFHFHCFCTAFFSMKLLVLLSDVSSSFSNGCQAALEQGS